MLTITLVNGQRAKIGEAVFWLKMKDYKPGKGQSRICIDAPKELIILREDITAFRKRIDCGQIFIESKFVTFPLHSHPSKETVHTQHSQDHPKSE